MTIYIIWLKSDAETVEAKYHTETGETLARSWENETHYATGSARLTSHQQENLEADADFVGVTFSDARPEWL